MKSIQKLLVHDHKRGEHQALLSDIAKIVDEGALKPLLDEKTFTMLDAGAAYDHLKSGQAMGKVIIEL